MHGKGEVLYGLRRVPSSQLTGVGTSPPSEANVATSAVEIKHGRGRVPFDFRLWTQSGLTVRVHIIARRVCHKCLRLNDLIGDGPGELARPAGAFTIDAGIDAPRHARAPPGIAAPSSVRSLIQIKRCGEKGKVECHRCGTTSSDHATPGSRSIATPTRPTGAAAPFARVNGLAMPLQFHRAVEKIEIWSASSEGYSFVISHESPAGPGLHGRAGYMASWRAVYEGRSAIKIIGSPFKTFDEAEAACDTMLELLMSEN